MVYKIGKFEVIKRCDGWHIEENCCYVRSDAITDLFYSAPIFDSFIHAVKWLKDNVNYLV